MEGPLVGILGFIIVIVVLRWAPRLTDSLLQAFSGEQRSFMCRGFLRHSTRMRRTIELQTIISQLAMITRLNLPLCRALDSAAIGEQGRVKKVLRELSRRIRQGEPVSSALEAALQTCPTQLIATLQRAESHGQLSQALDQQERMIDSMIDLHFKTTAHTRHAVAYGLVMMLFCSVMVFGIVVFLIPKFKEIFLDFDVRLPEATMALLNVVDWFVVNAGTICIVAMLTLVAAVLMLARSRRTNSTRRTTHLIAWVRSRFPMTSSLDYGLGMARAIRAMSLGIRSGAANALAENLSTVVSETNFLRTRLDVFSTGVSQGVPPHAAAQDAKLGDVFVCALRMIERGEDPARVLAHAADYYETMAYRWWHALAAITGPLMTVGMGIVVGFVALALFMPLIALIDSVAGKF